ncbi:helix-turn-helix domain-containing protein [Acidithiobacillus caldus]|jgi:phage terminase Nu1 subunit (DNA packaging protein)|uniref:helix-turn-helix domain-containing protein n=1 Tax=Acidithiobacillus caldus TaxID=33059 RepID=UPI001C064F9F|nr:helix-turn-helix domain-containing protein [Acidithiobacillus caldus]MBU2763457.1 helix-turn-helix domain-containing protein [Acidithiobacillus caldus]MBU2771657.1 helix-turn-helix domain-containing protein [Acidithiobacillus caldus]MBU2783528.1 helix-turn-helix domain-containing protein [Acidithiobacillus caldus]
MHTNSETVSQIMADIARALNCPPEAIPAQVDETAAAQILNIKKSTLSNWRCTGRYHLPYIKTGRLVRYRTFDLAEWIARRRVGAEG